MRWVVVVARLGGADEGLQGSAELGLLRVVEVLGEPLLGIQRVAPVGQGDGRVDGVQRGAGLAPRLGRELVHDVGVVLLRRD